MQKQLDLRCLILRRIQPLLQPRELHLGRYRALQGSKVYLAPTIGSNYFLILQIDSNCIWDQVFVLPKLLKSGLYNIADSGSRRPFSAAPSPPSLSPSFSAFLYELHIFNKVCPFF